MTGNKILLVGLCALLFMPVSQGFFSWFVDKKAPQINPNYVMNATNNCTIINICDESKTKSKETQAMPLKNRPQTTTQLMMPASNLTLARAEKITICVNSRLRIELFLVIALLFVSLLLLLFIILYCNERSLVRALKSKRAKDQVKLPESSKLDQISIAKDDPRKKIYENPLAIAGDGDIYQSIGPTGEGATSNSHVTELNQKWISPSWNV